MQVKTFHVYVNKRWPKKAKIHFSDCGCCNDGRGTQGRSNNKESYWIGPLSTFQGALAKASETQMNVTRCGHCQPH